MVEGRILLAVAAAMQGDTESIFTMMKFAVLPIAKVFVMCFLGFILATKYVNILTPRSRKLLNGLVFTLFLPCLIFTQLGRAVTLRKMIDWWFIPANVVIATITGSIIGFFVATVVRPPHNYFKFTMVQIGVGNIGNVPLVLISAVCQDKGNPFGDSSSCNRLGSAYISFGQWVGAVILYTYVFYMLTPPKESDTLQRPSHEVRLLVDESENLKTPFLQETDGNAYLESTDWRVRSREIYNNLASLAERLKLKQIMQPPIIASSIRPMAAAYFVTKLGIASAIIANNAGCPTIIEIKILVLAMVMGAIPSIKKLILEDDAPLFFITDSCVILGDAMIPCILLALGGNLVGGPGPGSSTLGLRTTAAIIFGRLVLVPPVGLGIVMLADKLGFLPPDDKMFRFVLLLQHSMPTSVLAGAVANLRGFGEREAAAVLFWVHIFAIFSMAGWIILYLHVLF